MKNKGHVINTILLGVIVVYLVIISVQMNGLSEKIEQSNNVVGQVSKQKGTFEDEIQYQEVTENITEQIGEVEQTEKTEEVQNIEDTEILVQQNEIEMGTIETPYCKLEYPKEYFEYLYSEDGAEGDAVYKTFYCEFDNCKIELFTIYFNNPKAGYHIGYIKNDQDDVSLNIVLSDYERDDTISDEEFEIVRNMQEAVNDIIQSFIGNENYFTKQ